MKTLSKLKVMCPMCNEEEVSVTMRPCGHEFCPGYATLVLNLCLTITVNVNPSPIIARLCQKNESLL